MRSQPTVIERTEQPYVGIKRLVTMDRMGEVADSFPQLFGWLDEQGIEPVGAPFFKYNVINMAGESEVEAGIAVAEPVAGGGGGEVGAGVLPAGRYTFVTHVGHPDELMEATSDLLEWAAREGLEWDMAEKPEGDWFACRLEVYNTDPAEQPDMAKWETDLVFKLAG